MTSLHPTVGRLCCGSLPIAMRAGFPLWRGHAVRHAEAVPQRRFELPSRPAWRYSDMKVHCMLRCSQDTTQLRCACLCLSFWRRVYVSMAPCLSGPEPGVRTGATFSEMPVGRDPGVACCLSASWPAMCREARQHAHLRAVVRCVRRAPASPHTAAQHCEIAM